MAARQQPKGTGLAIQYDDIVPNSEWKDQPEATLLTIDLPGFGKEQIKVTYVHTSKMIRVIGERPVADRRWSRFNEVFTVPDNCSVDKIHGSFKNNVLTVTMPKERPEASRTVAEKVEKLEEKRLLEESIRKEKVEEAEKKKKNKKLLEEKEELIKKLLDEAKAKEMAEEKNLQEEAKAKEKKLAEEATLEKMIHERKSEEKILKPEERKLPEVVYAKLGFGGVGEVVKSTEEKLGDLVEKEKKIGKGIIEKIKRKEITSEEKKLMVNVGVAALVIFALGAYVSYSFCSSPSAPSSSCSSPPSSSSSSTKPE